MVRARGAQRGQPRVLGPGDEVEHHVGVGVVADLRPVGRGQAADHRGQRGRAGVPLGLGQRLVPGDDRAERLGRPFAAMNSAAVRMISSERASHSSLVAPHAVMPCPPRMHPDGLRVGRGDRGDVQAELEAGPPPRHPRHPVAEALRRSASPRPPRWPGRCRNRGAGGRRAARRPARASRCRSTARRPPGAGPHHPAQAVQAEVERRDHLILPVHARVDVHQRAQPVQPQHRQPGRGQRAQVPARALDPQQLDVLAGDRIGRGALGRGVAAGVVRVPRVRAEPVRPSDQFLDDRSWS